MALRRSSAVEELVNSVFHVFAHFDLRRPGALEAFARQFLRRVNAEFAAAGDFAGGVIEHVDPDRDYPLSCVARAARLCRLTIREPTLAYAASRPDAGRHCWRRTLQCATEER